MTHPIENIMKTTMENLKEMIDVDTVIGSAVDTVDGTTIIPVSKVSFGFVAGGGEYNLDMTSNKNAQPTESNPFAGGAGAGVSVSPTGFLVVGGGTVRMISAQIPTYIDRIIEAVPGLVCEVKKAFDISCDEKKMPPEDKPEGDEPFAM